MVFEVVTVPLLKGAEVVTVVTKMTDEEVEVRGGGITVEDVVISVSDGELMTEKSCV